MNSIPQAVERHYGRGSILTSIREGLRASGKDPDHLVPEDLAPVDEFHVRGRESTIELAGRAALRPGMRALDVGCGLGGSARYLAAEHGCVVTGVDLTQEYVDAARELARMVGLADRVEFRRASALELPFPDASFDLVWTEHVQMNIADKRGFYGELARVTRPGGQLLFHDIFQGEGGTPFYPVPWAEDPAISFLAPPGDARAILESLGYEIPVWEDLSGRTLTWLLGMLERAKGGGPPPVGLHLLLGATTQAKFDNSARNLREQRIAVIQARAVKH